MTTEFEKLVKDDSRPLVYDFSYPEKPVLIVFAGMANKIEIPPFEFFKITNTLNVNKVFVRDLHKCWYHKGLYNLTSSISETVEYINNLLNQHQTTKRVVFGNSMGGYAALLFGKLIKADLIQVFSPNSDIRNGDYIRYLNEFNEFQRLAINEYSDLKKILKQKPYYPEIHLHFNLRNKFDRYHALRLGLIKNLNFHFYFGKSHALISKLKTSGRLFKLLQQALSL